MVNAIRQLFFLASPKAAAATALACSLLIGAPYSGGGAAGAAGAGAGAGCCAKAVPASASAELMPSAIKKPVRMALSPTSFPSERHDAAGRNVMMLSKISRLRTTRPWPDLQDRSPLYQPPPR